MIHSKNKGEKIPIKNLKFLNFADDEEKQSDGAKMIDFVEHQQDMMEYTKGQCALISKIFTSKKSNFDLPLNLKKTTGPIKLEKMLFSFSIGELDDKNI